MLKLRQILIVSVIVLGILLVGINGTATAESDIASGSWSAGTEFLLLPHVLPPPYPWIQQLGNGVEVTEKTLLCHNFDGGPYGWTADIYQWVSGEWQKLPTTQGYDSHSEGHWVACATAPKAGKYALFGYWTSSAVKNSAPDSPLQPTPACSYDMSGWEFDKYGEVFPETHLYLFATVPDVPEGTAFTYQVITGHANLTMAASGSGTVSLSEGPNIVAFTDQEIQMTGNGTAVIRLTSGGCSKNITWNFTAPPETPE